MLITIISFILVFGLLVMVHELGHFITARMSGVKIHEFSIGMGPAIFKKQGPETLYALRAIPLGGYVKMEGEDEASEDARSFSNVKPWKRLIILAAGAAMNFILAYILLLILMFSVGSPTNVIESTIEDYPAHVSGILSGDRIIAINGKEIDSWDEVTDTINISKGDPLEIKLQRNDENLVFKMTPLKGDDGTFKIGIQPKYEKNISNVFKDAGQMFKSFFMSIFEFLGRLDEKEVREGVSGPVGIISAIGQASQMGLLYIIRIAAYISINLGIFNLLPFPALDGGRIVFVLIEMIMGKPVSREKEGYVHFVGIVILLSLTVFLTFKDLSRF